MLPAKVSQLRDREILFCHDWSIKRGETGGGKMTGVDCVVPVFLVWVPVFLVWSYCEQREAIVVHSLKNNMLTLELTDVWSVHGK